MQETEDKELVFLNFDDFREENYFFKKFMIELMYSNRVGKIIIISKKFWKPYKSFWKRAPIHDVDYCNAFSKKLADFIWLKFNGIIIQEIYDKYLKIDDPLIKEFTRKHLDDLMDDREADDKLIEKTTQLIKSHMLPVDYYNCNKILNVSQADLDKTEERCKKSVASYLADKQLRDIICKLYS